MAQHESVYGHVRISASARRCAVAAVAAVAVLLGVLAGSAPATASSASSASARATSSAARPAVTGRLHRLGDNTLRGTVSLPETSRFRSVPLLIKGPHAIRRTNAHNDRRTGGLTASFDVDNLPDGTYHVVFNRVSGYSTAAPEFYADHPETQTGTQAYDTVTVSGGQVVDGVDATLVTGGSISGTLVDPATGEPRSGCELQAFTRDNRLVTRSGTTRSDGTFVIPGLSTGSYLVRVVPRNSSKRRCDGGTQVVTDAAGGPLGTPGHAVPIAVTLGHDTSIHTLGYTSGAVITGHVDLPDNALPGDRHVIARQGSYARRVSLDADGDYTIKGLRAGSYRVTFDRLSGEAVAAPQFYNGQPEGATKAAANRVVVRLGQTQTLHDAHLVKGGVIAGQVVDPQGHPLDGCIVQAFTTDQSLVTRTALSGAVGAGQFKVTGLSTGDYRLRVLRSATSQCSNKPEFYGGGSALGGPLAATSIPVVRGKSVSVGPLTYRQGGVITGHVTFPDRQSRVRDRWVTVRRPGWQHKVRVRDDGTWQMRGLRAGSYRVTFNRVSGYAVGAAQFYQGQDESQGIASARRVVLAPGQTMTDVDATLRTSGSITGSLLDPDGNPLTCTVQAFTPDGTLVTRDSLPFTGDGGFSITGLSSGRYYLRVLPISRFGRYGRVGCNEGVEFAPTYGGPSTTLSSVGPGTPVTVVQGRATQVGTLVYGPRTAISNTAAPTISGSPQVGSVLTASPGTWAPTAGTSFTYTYAWSVGGVTVPGATGAQYVPVAADAGRTVSVRVTARQPNLVPATASSGAIGPIVPASAPPPPPTTTGGPGTTSTPTATLVVVHRPGVAGHARVGGTLRAAKATVKPAPTAVHYQWLRNGKAIKHATHARYRVTRADAGQRISVRVTYVRVGVSPLVVVARAVRVAKADPHRRRTR